MRLGFRMGAGGGRAVFGHNRMRKCPLLQPLNKTRTHRASPSSIRHEGTTNLDKDGKQESEDINQKNEVSGRYFLFNNTFITLDRTRSVIPPLRSDYDRNLRPFGLSEGFSRSHAGQPFILSHTKRCEVKPSPVLPSPLVINGKNVFSEMSCKPNRSTVNYSTHNLVTGKDNQKTLTYPDPMIGAPPSFMHRISELSSLQEDTGRQEKLKKMRKSRKPPS